MLLLLNRIGFVRILPDGRVRWPISVDPPWIWGYHLRTGDWFGVFRNLPGVIKWQPGRLLPRRWGFRIIGLEIGDRG